MPTKIERVQQMETAAFTGDWDGFKSYLTSDVYYRVGNTLEVRGPQAIEDYLKRLLTSELAIRGFNVKAVWETASDVVMEMNVTGLRIPDNKEVEYPCLDVYRFTGEKISDWRVYAIEPTYVK